MYGEGRLIYNIRKMITMDLKRNILAIFGDIKWFYEFFFTLGCGGGRHQEEERRDGHDDKVW